jgi:hypothetical protein
LCCVMYDICSHVMCIYFSFVHTHSRLKYGRCYWVRRVGLRLYICNNLCKFGVLA